MASKQNKASEIGLTNAQKAKDYTTVAVVVGAVALAVLLPATREFLAGLHAGSTAGAVSLYAGAAALVFVCYKSLMNTAEWRGGGVTGILNSNEGNGFHAQEVSKMVNGYYDNFGEESRKQGGDHDSLLAKRKENYMSMVNSFYTLVTDFYEYGWGDSFHFANRFIGESHKESLRRAEYFLASKLHLNDNSKVLDIGCGIGGPMRAIARFSGAEVTGINNCDYQIKVGNRYNEKWSLQKKCIYFQADFMNLPVADNSFDAAYQIEATCHAPDKAACFEKIFNALKPGGLFTGYEWVVTHMYDERNQEHVSIREGIEVGNGLPVIPPVSVVIAALEKAGFEVVEHFDTHATMHTNHMEIPWYATLAGMEWNLTGFRMTPFGRAVTHFFVQSLELLRIAPKGSVKVSKMLNDTAIDLSNGGKLEIFSPDYFFLARKPLNAVNKTGKKSSK